MTTEDTILVLGFIMLVMAVLIDVLIRLIVYVIRDICHLWNEKDDDDLSS